MFKPKKKTSGLSGYKSKRKAPASKSTKKTTPAKRKPNTSRSKLSGTKKKIIKSVKLF
jgi:hypothetical protein